MCQAKGKNIDMNRKMLLTQKPRLCRAISRRLAFFLWMVAVAVFHSSGGASLAVAPPERDLLFYLSFDRMSPLADYAAGNPKPLDFKDDLEFRPEEGVNSKNAFLRRDGETLSYDLHKNFDPQQGTLSVWIQPVNWEPAGEGLKPVGHKHFLSIQFRTSVGTATLSLYKYYMESDFAFLITTALNRQNWLAKAPGAAYRKGQWIKLDATWADGQMVFYINGAEVGSARYEQPYIEVARAGVENGKILVNPILWGGENEPWSNQTVVDDVRIFGRALSPADILKRFVEDGGAPAGPTELPPVTLAGLDLDDGRLDRVTVSLDLSLLEDPWQKAVAQGNVEATVHLLFNGQEVCAQTDRSTNIVRSVRMENAYAPGDYEMILALTNLVSGESRELRGAAVKPELSFAGNTFGKEDFVPSPWTPIEIEGSRVRLWNRAYEFDGPFIRQALSGGHALLANGVQLWADTGAGDAPFQFDAPILTERQQDFVVFTGEGRAGDVTIRYRNTVWFDGFSRVQFTVGPAGTTLRHLDLRYAVKPDYSLYHTTPRWHPFEKEETSYEFSHFAMNGFTQLWLLGEVDGFCWIPENEGNWVLPPDGSKPIRIRKTEMGAEVSIALVSDTVTVPEHLDYAFGFIATPTRPLPEDFRTFCTAGRNLKNCRAAIIGWGGIGFTGYATLVPMTAGRKSWKSYTQEIEDVSKKGQISLFPYCSPTGLCTLEPVVRYFKQSWQFIGMGSFPIRDVYGQSYHQMFVTPTTIMRDFLANKVEQLLSRRNPEIGGIYYDLCKVMPSRSTLAGGSFTDAFGRDIPSRLNTIELRECMMRTLKICRKYGKRAWYHGHVDFNPAVMGLGDFWYPGEHLASALAENPYYYVEEMPEEAYRVGFNPHQKGVGVVNLPVIGRLHRERNEDPGPTESMLGMMLLHDVISSATQAHLPTIDKMWGIRIANQLDQASFVRYDRNNRFSSSNPAIVCSEYRFENGKRFAVVVNRSATDQTATLSFGDSVQSVFEEWEGMEWPSQKGVVEVMIPARLFRILILSPNSRTNGVESRGEVTSKDEK